MKNRKRSIRTLAFQLGQFCKGVGRRTATVGTMVTASAPAPGFTGLGEANLIHQSGDTLLAEAHRRRECGVEWLVAAGRAHLVRMACEAIGQVDTQPFLAQAAISEGGAARIGVPRCPSADSGA